MTIYTILYSMYRYMLQPIGIKLIFNLSILYFLFLITSVLKIIFYVQTPQTSSIIEREGRNLFIFTRINGRFTGFVLHIHKTFLFNGIYKKELEFMEFNYIIN